MCVYTLYIYIYIHNPLRSAADYRLRELRVLRDRRVVRGPVDGLPVARMTVYVYTYIYIYMCVSLSLSIYIYIYVHVCITNIYIYIYIYIHIYTYMYMQTNQYYICLLCAHICICVYK